MPKVKGGFYAVRKGRSPGVYHTWYAIIAQIKGFAGAVYKKFSTSTEAEKFAEGRSNPEVGVTSILDSARETRRVETEGTSTRTVAAASASTAFTAYEKTRVVQVAAVAVDADERDCDVVYCDGACKGNGQVGSIAGVGVWWGVNDPRNIIERCPGDQTNNRAELIAIVRILETTPTSKRTLVIKTDSQYSIKCFELWFPKWSSNGFKTSNGTPVKNAPLIQYLASLLETRRRKGQKVRLKYVRGHNGHEGNEHADRLANMGTVLPPVPERNWERLRKIMETTTTTSEDIMTNKNSGPSISNQEISESLDVSRDSDTVFRSLS
ncbi:hypothetical protein SERLA73DRAFT_44067 [Serpula lacrymans var. lacrymans S7.3]|uniref:Ribonuclease H n=1 Tax=Serpula lacrymans var. lacrymans (strain S7.3) TaxID=936435 RepID=F8PFK8_SERL3|nr:hypothetical protein SERLA73DRAFT_44067 [Serpula lacrymans var. lacrymans S7.3]